MLYRKNVGPVERILRILAGSSLIACGFTIFGQTAVAWIAAASGLLTIATGIIGFCPACALAGRAPSSQDLG